MLRLRSVFGVFLICFVLLASMPTFAQDASPNGEDAPVAPPIPQPQMQNVFFNMLWGGLLGGTLMISAKILDDQNANRYSMGAQLDNFATGAISGAFLGAAVGYYIAWNDIQFDSRRTRLAVNETQQDETPLWEIPLQNPKRTVANLNDYQRINGVPLVVYLHKF